MKSTITAAIIVLAFIGIFVWGYQKESTPTTEAEAKTEDPSTASVLGAMLTASRTLHDFGNISMKDGNVTTEFTVTNETRADITVRDISTSCMCTTAFVVMPDGSTKGSFGMPGHGGGNTLANETIKAGEERVIRVTFDPNAHGPAGVGTINRSVRLTDADGTTLDLQIQAVVTP